MSQTIWAKIVNDEIMQMHDEDPTGLWHPDMIAQNDLPGHWEEVPAECHIGWKRDKSGEWHDGAWWYEKNIIDNPTPPPGPPSAGIALRDSHTTGSVDITVVAVVQTPEEYTLLWEIAGETYDTGEVTVTITKLEDTIQNLKVKLTVTSPGGTTTTEEVVRIPQWAPPVATVEL